MGILVSNILPVLSGGFSPWFYSLLFTYFVRTRTRISNVLCGGRVKVSVSTYPRQVMSTLRINAQLEFRTMLG